MKFSRFKFSFCWTFNILTHSVNIVKCFFNFLRLTFPVSKACRFSTAWLLYQTVYALSRTFSNFFELFHPGRSASAWLQEKSSSALKRQLDYVTTLWSFRQVLSGNFFKNFIPYSNFLSLPILSLFLHNRLGGHLTAACDGCICVCI